MMDPSDQGAEPPSEEDPPVPPPDWFDWQWPAYQSHREPGGAEADPAAPDPPEPGAAAASEVAAEADAPGPEPDAPEVSGAGPPDDSTAPMPVVASAPPRPDTPEPATVAPAAWGAWAGWGPPPGGPGQRRGRGWIIALALLATVALVAGGLLGLGPTLRRWVSTPAASRAGGGTTATSGTAQLTITTPGQGDPDAMVRPLLAARAGAVLHHDRAAFLATVDQRRRTFYRAQAALFDRMATVPFSALEYRAGPDLTTARVRSRYAPAPVYLSEVRARYRFRGQDSAPVTAHYYYTFTLTSAGWRLAGQGDLPARKDDAEIWDSGPVRSLSSARTLVVHHPGERALAERLLSAAERGYGQVDASWSAAWDHKVVILVPHDQSEAERLVHGRDLSDVAAVASSQVEQGPAHRLLGNRVIVNTSVMRRYNGLNLQIVVTHEMTHVATRRVGVGVPLFLVEGFADYAALRPVDAPLRITRPALAAAMRGGRFHGRLPSDDELLGSDAALAYDEASSFCLWVARTFGEAKVQRLYRSFAGVEEPTPQVLDQRLRRVLGISRAAAEPRWAAFVRQAL
jgi:hypothetical protein